MRLLFGIRYADRKMLFRPIKSKTLLMGLAFAMSCETLVHLKHLGLNQQQISVPVNESHHVPHSSQHAPVANIASRLLTIGLQVLHLHRNTDIFLANR